MKSFLDLPMRPEKPRSVGMTYLLDSGVPTNYFIDVVESAENIVDGVKFGWGTALITKDIERKIRCLHDLNIPFYFGGTLFEKALLQNRLTEFSAFCKDSACTYVEVSNGTIDITNTEKAKYIEMLSSDFQVISEVGYKDNQRSEELFPAKWIEYIKEDFNAGSVFVITEARESGKSGICRSNGELRYGLIREIVNSDVDTDKLIFEAPNKQIQAYLLANVGPNANLSNISFGDVIGLESLRQGLRSDTLMTFENRDTHA